MKIDKKYVMIVTAEDERYGTAGYGLDFFANSPAEGILNDIVYGDNLEELMVSSDGESNEGLFYLLYRMKKNDSGISTGIKIGSGTVDWSAIEEEILLEEKKRGEMNLLILHGFILYLIVQMNMILLISQKTRKELKRIRCLMQQLLYSKSCGDNTQAKRMVYILATRHTET